MSDQGQPAFVMGYDPVFRVLQNVLKKCNETGADESIRQGVEMAIKLGEDRLSYCDKITTEPSPALKTISGETMTFPFAKAHEEGKTKKRLTPMMISGGFEGKFLQSLALIAKAKHVLEVGMLTGYAALACAEVLPEDGTVTTCEVDPYLEGVARKFFNNSPHGKKIEIRIGPASDTLVELAKEKRQYDFVFIDANKDGYIDYYKAIISNNLLTENGVIAFDNTLSFGMPYSVDEMSQSSNPVVSEASFEHRRDMGDPIRQLNEYMMSQDEMLKVLVPIQDGVLLVQRKPATL